MRKTKPSFQINPLVVFTYFNLVGGELGPPKYASYGTGNLWSQESIDTVVSRPGQPREYNPCTHTVITSTGKLGKLAYSTFNSPDQKTGQVFRDVTWPYNIGPFDPMPVGFSAVMQEAYGKIKPFESTISLPNFIWELRELPQLVEYLRKMWKLSKRRVFHSRTAATANAVADTHLTYAFGVMPLLGDIQSLISLYQDFLESYTNFVNNNKKVLVARSSQLVDCPKLRTIKGQGGPWIWTEKRSGFTVRLQCTIKYKYTILGPIPPPVPSLLLKWAGFRFDPRILWNALPYSFMVDWVLKVGDWLKQWDEGTIPCRITILDCCVSQKESYKVSLWHEYAPTGTWTGSPPMDGYFGTIIVKHYRRKKVTVGDLRPFLPKIDGLSLRELALGVSLGVAKARLRS